MVSSAARLFDSVLFVEADPRPAVFPAARRGLTSTDCLDLLAFDGRSPLASSHSNTFVLGGLPRRFVEGFLSSFSATYMTGNRERSPPRDMQTVTFDFWDLAALPVGFLTGLVKSMDGRQDGPGEGFTETLTSPVYHATYRPPDSLLVLRAEEFCEVRSFSFAEMLRYPRPKFRPR